LAIFQHNAHLQLGFLTIFAFDYFTEMFELFQLFKSISVLVLGQFEAEDSP